MNFPKSSKGLAPLVTMTTHITKGAEEEDCDPI